MKMNWPALPDFRLTQEEVEQALETPVTEKYRFGEITVQPEGERPRLSNRLLVYAYKLFMQDKPMEFATLLKALFLLFSTGQLFLVKEGMVIQATPQMLINAAAQKEEDIDLGFDFSDVTVDMSTDLPDDYNFNQL